MSRKTSRTTQSPPPPVPPPKTLSKPPVPVAQKKKRAAARDRSHVTLAPHRAAPAATRRSQARAMWIGLGVIVAALAVVGVVLSKKPDDPATDADRRTRDAAAAGTAPTTPSDDITPTLVSSCDGRITDLLLSFSSADILPSHIELLKARGDIDRVIVLMAHESDAELYGKVLRDNGIDTTRIRSIIAQPFNAHVEIIPDGTNGSTVLEHLAQWTPWMQNSFHVVRRGNATTLVVSGPYDPQQRQFAMEDPHRNGDRDETYVPGLLCKNLRGYDCQSGPLLVGGNLLANDRHLFIGADAAVAALSAQGAESAPPEQQRTAFLAWQQSVVQSVGGGKSMFILGSTLNGRPAAEHIDLFVTPTGQHDASGQSIILVGDMHLATTLLKTIPRDRLATREQQWQQTVQDGLKKFQPDQPHYVRELYTSRDNNTAHTSAMMLDELDMRDILQDTIYTPNAWQQQTADQLDAHARELETLGYAVIRIPFLDTRRDWSDVLRPIISYNNSLAEHFRDAQGKKHTRITLSTFGIPELDHATIDILQNAGMEVTPAGGYEFTAPHKGALVCISKVLQRTAN